MCGICGMITYDGAPVSDDAVRRMCGAIAHRGADDAGIHVKEMPDVSGRPLQVGLGHQRLSIIDLSASGHQPMCNEDESIWIVCNGEIYNFPALRGELERSGHQFRSNSDTEVILHLYEEEGLDAVRHLNGMFAFALFDERIGRLWMCRDRIGIKPLVYSFDGRRLAFASEIKALLTLPDMTRDLDREALDLYLAFNYVPAPYTIYRGIQKLPPGHSLVSENGEASIRRYWKVPRKHSRERSGRSFAKQVAFYQKRLYDTMTDAVLSQMIADVPLGAFLSGGIDSSIVVALMARHSDQPVKTFSIGFADAALFDETRYSREVARMYRTDHHEFKLTGQDMLDVLPDVLNAFDEPFADSSAIPTHIVSKHTRRHVKVALSGDGGDELFAGYRSYMGEYWYPLYAKIPLALRDAARRLLDRVPDSRDVRWMEYVRRLKKFVHAQNGPYAQRLLKLKSVFPDHLRDALLAGGADGTRTNNGSRALKWVEALVEAYDGDRINTMLYTDLTDSLPGDMLQKVDWMSMQHALEVRVPFLDHRMVELAFEIPGEMKLHGITTKYILKRTFSDILPHSLKRRPKAGFEVPVGKWLKTDLRFLLTDYLSEKRIVSQGLFNYDVIQQLVTDFLRNRTDTAWMIWNLIVFQYWYDTYYNA